MQATLERTTSPKNFTKSISVLPVFKLADGTEVQFQAHHVIPLEVLKNNRDFFNVLESSTGWSVKDFARNGIALPDSPGFGIAQHQGSHPDYSAFINTVVQDLSKAHQKGNFGGKSKDAWLNETAGKLDGLVSHIRHGLSNPDSNYHLKNGDVKAGTDISPANVWDNLRQGWDKNSLDFEADSIVGNSPMYQIGKQLGTDGVYLDTALWQNARKVTDGQLIDLRNIPEGSRPVVQLEGIDSLRAKLFAQEFTAIEHLNNADSSVSATAVNLGWIKDYSPHQAAMFNIFVEGGKKLGIAGSIAALAITSVQAAEFEEQGDFASANRLWVEYFFESGGATIGGIAGAAPGAYSRNPVAAISGGILGSIVVGVGGGNLGGYLYDQFPALFDSMRGGRLPTDTIDGWHYNPQTGNWFKVTSHRDDTIQLASDAEAELLNGYRNARLLRNAEIDQVYGENSAGSLGGLSLLAGLAELMYALYQAGIKLTDEQMDSLLAAFLEVFEAAGESLDGLLASEQLTDEAFTQGLEEFQGLKGGLLGATLEYFDGFGEFLNFGSFLGILGDYRDLNPASAFPRAEAKGSPIVLDLDGDGIQTVGQDQNFHFDIDANGFAEKTGWVSGTDGFLVRDLNADGTINSGAELFGNHTLLESGDRAANGYEALKELDVNSDGLIDHEEAVAAGLKIWTDTNSDGISQASELRSLEEAGVAVIETEYDNTSEDDGLGNTIRQRASAITLEGETIDTADVWFGANRTITKEINTVPVSEEVAALPDAQAFGNVASLHQAMMADEALKALVEQYVAASDSEKAALLQPIVYKWTGSEDTNPNSRDEYGHVYMDARKVVTLENLIGRGYDSGQGGNHVQGPQAAGILKAEYARFEAYVGAQLLSQTTYKDAYAQISLSYNQTTNKFAPDFSGFITNLQEHVAAGEEEYVIGTLNVLSGLDNYSSQLREIRLYVKSDGVLAEYFADAVFHGTDGEDTINGTSGDDFIRGDKGNDILSGGRGNDVYKYATGDGSDQISDSSGNDILSFDEGITLENISVSRDATSLFITLLNEQGEETDSVIQINNTFNTNGAIAESGIEQFRFHDGSAISLKDLIDKKISKAITDGDDFIYGTELHDQLDGLAGNDYLYAGAGDDTVEGGLGNDFIQGGSGSDTLSGGDGNDLIAAEAGDDVLEGGAGDDELSGGAGADILRGGIGNDTLDGGDGDDQLYGGEGNDTLSVRFGNNALSGDGGDDTLKVERYNGYNQRTAQNTFSGGIGNDRLEGYSSADTYLFNRGDGQDVINDDGYASYGGADKIVLGEGILREHVTVTREGNHIVLLIAGPAGVADDRITIEHAFTNSNYKIETVEFADGTVLTSTDLQSEAQIIRGTNGDDTVIGTDGNDILRGHAGNDTLDGGAGNDRYLFGKGDGQDVIAQNDAVGNDALVFDSNIATDELWFSRQGEDLQINIAGSDDQVTVDDWYTHDAAQLDEIEVGSTVLRNSQVNQLVSAMAAYSVPEGDGGVIAQSTKDALQPVLSQVWEQR